MAKSNSSATHASPKLVSLPRPKRLAVSRPVVPTNPTLVQRRDGRQLRRMTVYLAPELAKRLQHHCVETDQDMSDVIQEALGALLARR